MLQSVRSQIIKSFLDALRADDGPQFNGKNIPVFRSRTNPLHRDDSIPSTVVEPVNEPIQSADHDSQLRKLTLHIVCVFGDPGIDDEGIDEKVEPQTSWVEKVIAADETFGGLANESAMSEWVWHIGAIDEDYIGAEGTLEIKYYTARNAPDVRGDSNG